MYRWPLQLFAFTAGITKLLSAARTVSRASRPDARPRQAPKSVGTVFVRAHLAARCVRSSAAFAHVPSPSSHSSQPQHPLRVLVGRLMGGCVSATQPNGPRPSSASSRLPQDTAAQFSTADTSSKLTPMSSASEQPHSSTESHASENAQPRTNSPPPSPRATDTSPTTHKTIHHSADNSISTQPPLSHLYQNGFITPLSAQFKRSHGKVPQLQWQQHKLHIKGLVHEPKVFTMNELASMPCVTMPVSITSAANRAKELNMLQSTEALNWGAAATHCSLWTGVRLSHLLNLCQIDVSRSKHVHFEASELEALPKGPFSCSIDISTALNPFSDVLIAYKQNGEHLSAEHGFPIRVIVPGWIGARMVKWLSTIEVAESPVDNYYYRFENRIFPSFVDRKLADSQRYWYQEQYAFNELNINSVIVHPSHQHVLKLEGKTFEIQGYAYAGSGKKITRVELSLDNGLSWNVCSLTFPEEEFSHATQYGKYYCWMFWKYDVQISVLLKALKRSGELRCRAWDQSNNTQPREINWNLLGCGNNAHYIVKSKLLPGAENRDAGKEATKAAACIKFLHPTVAGSNHGGWMEVPTFGKASVSESPEEEKEISAMKPPLPSGSVVKKDQKSRRESGSEPENRSISQSSVLSNTEKTESETNLRVYSLRGLSIPGEEVYEPFPEPRRSRSTEIATSTQQKASEEMVNSNMNASGGEGDEKPVKALDPDAWLSFELVDKKIISYDTRLFKFKLPSKNHYLGVPVGQHILARTMINGNPLIRAYTPISSEKELGYFTLCIKVYFAGADPKHPDGGKMSQFMECLLLGDKMSITGPHGNVHYKGNGLFSFQTKEKRYRKVGLICGGTGITPAFQVMHSVYQNSSDETDISLLYANRSHFDILLQADLDLMAEKRDNIHVWYTLEKIPNIWMYSQGLVTEQMIRDRIPEPAEDTLIVLCGPPEMVSLCTLSLRSIGHDLQNVRHF